jgi:PhoPQ-activated pathogenicity-related protein
MKMKLPVTEFVLSLAAGLSLTGCGNLSQYAGSHQATALDRYVAVRDTNYSFRLVKTIQNSDYTGYVLEMTSQSWLTTNEVDRTLWKHWLTIVMPPIVDSSKSLLFISGGGNGNTAPESVDSKLAAIARGTKTVVSELKMVPNQPLVFAGESRGRSEDALIAYTWDKFLRTGDERWPARLPMTKSAVRAMDTVQTFCASAEGGRVKVDGFFVAGGSKRGWTTWTTAAVDKRVVGIAPLVIDMLNVEPSFRHHWEAYGFYAPAVGDYERMGLMEWNGTPEYRALMKIEEPYEYRDRLTMPKFIINSSGDQFFLPDSSQFYFNDLPGVKYLRYVPNTDHSLRNSDAWETLLVCYQAVLYNAPLPRFSWTRQKDGSIRVQTMDRPSAVKLWQATNPNARDFRLQTLGPVWQSTPLTDEGHGVFIGKVEPPAKGWTACFVELSFPASYGRLPFKFTTQVSVVPDVVPYKFKPNPTDNPDGFTHQPKKAKPGSI